MTPFQGCSGFPFSGLWKEVMNKINSGQMPPKKKARPDAKEAFAVASWVAERLHETEMAAQGAGGRVPMRRMNRVEYANSVRDLFSLEEGFARRIEKELPAASRSFSRARNVRTMDICGRFSPGFCRWPIAVLSQTKNWTAS